MTKITRLTFLLILLRFVSLSAQDSHYWNNQYGMEASLLGGAVIGSVSDLSAAYYNPGALAMKKSAEFLFGARMFEINRLRAANSSIPIEITDQYLKPSPSFIAGTFSRDSTKKSKLTYSLFTKNNFDYSFENRLSQNSDSGNWTNIQGESIIKHQLNEVWAGASYSYKLSDNLGIGVTGFIIYRSQRIRKYFGYAGTKESDIMIHHNSTWSANYYNIRIMPKIGVSYQADKLELGLTAALPSLSVFGSGNLYTALSESKVDLTGAANSEGNSIGDYQEDKPSFYKNNFSFGFGGAYKFGKFKLHLSGEYFLPVSNFKVLNTENYSAYFDDSQITNDLRAELKAVFNYGIGIQFDFLEKFSGYLSYNTDYSSAVKTSKNNNEIYLTDWNITHFSGGGIFTIFKTKLTLGAEYSYGKTIKYIDYIKICQDELNGLNIPVNFLSQRIKLIFTFAYLF